MPRKHPAAHSHGWVLCALRQNKTARSIATGSNCDYFTKYPNRRSFSCGDFSYFNLPHPISRKFIRAANCRRLEGSRKAPFCPKALAELAISTVFFKRFFSHLWQNAIYQIAAVFSAAFVIKLKLPHSVPGQHTGKQKSHKILAPKTCSC